MPAQHDFDAYVDARWPVLVRSLVAEGLTVADAERAVARVLSRLRRGWSRVVRDQDADARVWADVREEAGLAPDPRALADALADDTLGAPDHPVEVGARPLDLVDAEASRRRRTLLRGVGAAVVAAALLAGYLAWATTREPAPEVVEQANPAPVPWYAEGVLHLRTVSVELPRLDRFVATGDDEVTFRDASGSWSTVDGDGTVTEAQEVPDPAATRADLVALVSPDGRFEVRIGVGGPSAYYPDGGAIALDRSRGVTVESGVPADQRVLDAEFAADGSITYVVSNQLDERSADTARRLSETGTLSLRTCTLAPLVCDDVVSVSGNGGNLRLR